MISHSTLETGLSVLKCVTVEHKSSMQVGVVRQLAGNSAKNHQSNWNVSVTLIHAKGSQV